MIHVKVVKIGVRKKSMNCDEKMSNQDKPEGISKKLKGTPKGVRAERFLYFDFSVNMRLVLPF